MKELEKFDNATDALAKKFVDKYFGKDYIYDDDYYWVGSQDQDREVLAVGDYFFNLEMIVDALRYKATEKQLFDYYDMELELGMKEEEIEVNFKNFVKNGKALK